MQPLPSSEPSSPIHRSTIRPPLIHLGQLRNQAKDLRDACRADQADALSRLRQFHPRHVDGSRRAVSLQDAQLVIAREQGYESWPKLVAAASEARPAADGGLTRVQDAFIGTSSAAQATRELLARSATARTPALLLGEPGTGKRLCAQLIHRLSGRAGEAPGRLSCSGQPTLTLSELCGHEVDAFTGARAAHAGWLQTGDRGSLLLEEVEVLDEDGQIRLQQYLEGGTFRRLGGETDLVSDVRILASSTKPLRPDLAAALREDLFYGLSVLVIPLPALRDRREDITPLARHFSERLFAQPAATGQEHSMQVDIPVFDAAALDVLSAYDWPGNVRQLRSVVERAVLTAATAQISADELQLTGVESAAS